MWWLMGKDMAVRVVAATVATTAALLESLVLFKWWDLCLVAPVEASAPYRVTFSSYLVGFISWLIGQPLKDGHEQWPF